MLCRNGHTRCLELIVNFVNLVVKVFLSLPTVVDNAKYEQNGLECYDFYAGVEQGCLDGVLSEQTDGSHGYQAA